MQGTTAAIRRGLLALAALALTGCVMPPEPAARNVILLVGDGMGVSTVTAARIYDGQTRGQPGEENLLSFERFPNVALVKTYNSNQQVPDSAGTATAMHTGIKTRAGVIGIGPDVVRRDCTAARRAELGNIADEVKARGKALGIVTTTRITHATPASVYAHLPERDWEADDFFTDEHRAAGCVDIARQFVDLPPDIAPDITLGGGWRVFRSSQDGGSRVTPGEDLIAEWLAGAPSRQFVSERGQLAGLDAGGPVLGLFARSHLEFEAIRDTDTTEPSLEEMTAAAIDYLESKDSGYYLLVEGGRIDHAHHIGQPGLALTETQAFARAVSVVLERVDLRETLVLVTADHSHVFTLAGYPTRGNDILGLVVGNDRRGEAKTEPTLAADGQPYTSVGYANGRNAVAGGPRLRPDTGLLAVAQSAIPVASKSITGELIYSETHGGEDVALYATGPGAERARGVIEQNLIYDIMMAAFGWRDP